MKKYNIFRLYVVEMKNGSDIHYFICKYNWLENTYLEIFTNEKIEMTSNLKVKPLCYYYLTLARCNNTMRKKMILDESDLFKMYITINKEASLNQLSQSEVTFRITSGILEMATLNFFPKEGVWDGHCFQKPRDLEMKNLPCHLRDDDWLAKMLREDQKLFYMGINTVLQFVKTSPFFLKKRHEYEQEIVKWQIDWMRSGGKNWIIDENYGGEFTFFTSVCDLGFRKGVVDTLSRIGISIDAIEEGIEKNADKWRNSFMGNAFQNEYEPNFIDFSVDFAEDNVSQEEGNRLQPVNPDFKEKWLKMRKYEYYQRHKDSVDKYGIVEADMVLSDEEVAELRIYLEQKHNERIAQITQYKQEISGPSRKAKVLKKLQEKIEKSM